MRFIFILFTIISIPVITFAGNNLPKSDFVYETTGEIREDFEIAKKDGRILVYNFEQQGCTYCLFMHKNVFSDKVVSKLLEKKFYFVQIDMRSNQPIYEYKEGLNYSRSSLAKTFGAFGSPTFVFFKQNSSFDEVEDMLDSVSFKLDGALEKDIFIKVLQQQLENY